MKCFNFADKKKCHSSVCGKNTEKVKIKITESLPTPADCLLSRLRMSFQMNGQLLAKIYRRDGKRKSEKEIFKKGEIILTDTVQGKFLMCTSTPWERNMPCSTQESAGCELKAAGITVP